MTGMTVRVRSPDPGDAGRLAEINVMTWRHAYAGIVPAAYLDGLDLAAFQERWRTQLVEGRAGASFLVATVDEVACGYVVFGGYRRQEDGDPDEDVAGWGEIYAIYTDPGFQGRGAGGALHDAAIGGLRVAGCTRAALWVLVGNEPSRRWYAARGWRPDGATSRWSGAGEPLVEVRLVHDLTSEAMA